MQSLAFEIMLFPESVNDVTAEKAVKAAHTLAKYCGTLGMVGGQVIDIESENKNAGIETLSEMDEKKTGALIKAACEMGCIIGGATQKQVEAATQYAHSIGLAFQIVDDILDVTSTSEELGKPVGSDEEEGKTTYVTLYGLEQASRRVQELSAQALEEFDQLSVRDGFLRELILRLVSRRK